MNKFSILIFAFLCIHNIFGTPLDDYVNQPDSHYGYTLLTTYKQDGYSLYILNFTSQKWLDETVTTNPIWWHFLCVTIPDKIIRSDAAFLLIDGIDFNFKIIFLSDA